MLNDHLVPSLRTTCFSFALIACVAVAGAQLTIVDVKVHSAGLEHNLLGDPADQAVSIFLPAAYAQDTQRRFPVLYFPTDILTRHRATLPPRS